MGSEKKLEQNGFLSSCSVAELKSQFCINESDIDLNLDTSLTQGHTDSSLADFITILTTNYWTASEVDNSVLNYITGLVPHWVAQKVDCELCVYFIRNSVGNLMEDNYFNNLQR